MSTIETVADIKLAGRSINNEWPVAADVRQKVVERMAVLAESGEPEIEIAAAKVLLAADLCNERKRVAEQKRLADEHTRKIQLIELAIKLGVVRDDHAGTGALPSE